MSSEPIEIALPSDENYFPGLLVTVYSISKNANPDVKLSFNILDGGIKDDSFRLLKESSERVHPRVTFQRYKINELDFADFPSWKGNKMTYVRYLLPKLLSDKKFVIYADSDCLWLANVDEIWKRRDVKIILQGVNDAWGEKTERPWFESHGLTFSEDKYFCNGLILMNLDLFREEHIIEKCTSFTTSYPDAQYADQSAFNHVIGKRARLLPSLFNFFTRDLTLSGITAPVVLHFANDIPWRDQYAPNIFLPPYKLLWIKYYADARGRPFEWACRECGYRYNKILQTIILCAMPRTWTRHFIYGCLLICGMRRTVDMLRHFAGKCGNVIHD